MEVKRNLEAFFRLSSFRLKGSFRRKLYWILQYPVDEEKMTEAGKGHIKNFIIDYYNTIAEDIIQTLNTSNVVKTKSGLEIAHSKDGLHARSLTVFLAMKVSNVQRLSELPDSEIQ